MNEFLASIITGINSVVHSYGWSMILFTLLIKLVLMPLDYKSRKSMRRMTNLKPQLDKLQKKYANDREKLNQKTSELYRREGINPLSGCLPMLISMVILFIMWSALRLVANTAMAQQAIELITTGAQTNEGWLWIKNIWMPDSPFSPVIADSNSLQLISLNEWLSVFRGLDAATVQALADLGITEANISGETVFAVLQSIPLYAQETQLWSTLPSLNLFIFNLSIYANNNGWFILPILSAVTQYLMTLTQPQTAPADPNGTQAGTNKFMKYFFPLFSLWICSSYNAMFSLYWVMSNLFGWIQALAMNKIFEMKEQQAKAAAGEEPVK